MHCVTLWQLNELCSFNNLLVELVIDRVSCMPIHAPSCDWLVEWHIQCIWHMPLQQPAAARNEPAPIIL